MASALEDAIRAVRDELLAEPVSPAVETPADINRHYCRYVAETVADRLDDGRVEILADGGRGHVHHWLAFEGRHHDAECPEGVSDHRELPFFQRHPEAAMGAVRAPEDPSRLRRRGMDPLYPGELGGPTSAQVKGRLEPADRRLALAGVLVGAALVAVGLLGEWSVHAALLTAVPWMTLFVDLELVGELIVVGSPLIFLWLRPALRANRV